MKRRTIFLEGLRSPITWVSLVIWSVLVTGMFGEALAQGSARTQNPVTTGSTLTPNRPVTVPGPETAGTIPEPERFVSSAITDIPENPGTTQIGTDGLSPENLVSPTGIRNSLGGLLALTLLTLVPAILLMTTSFVRISVVLAMLRQAFGMPQIPPPQVLTTLAVFLTLAIMLPVWTETYQTAIVPYSESTISGTEAIQRGILPIRGFMIRQIDRCGNAADIHLFLDRMPPEKAAGITTYEEVPVSVLLPAFLLSELKTAFWIGFRICLPFLVIDLVIAAILSAIGMIMVPPAVVAIPVKLLLFVLADGWRLLAGSLIDGFL
ncbi:MAG: flagellar type III secretion system pore protein FliP [Planctomycetia bacterium]|nr:flagellar type III secretion system pore protein FliP [Planctomycetia bacterium]